MAENEGSLGAWWPVQQRESLSVTEAAEHLQINKGTKWHLYPTAQRAATSIARESRTRREDPDQMSRAHS